jgi:hypothetical protein
MQIRVQCMGVDNLGSQTPLYNKSYLSEKSASQRRRVWQ